MERKIQQIEDNGYQLLSITDEQLRDKSLKRQVFNNINESVNCVEFHPERIKRNDTNTEFICCVEFHPENIKSPQ